MWGKHSAVYDVQSHSTLHTLMRFALCLILFLPFWLGLWIRCTSHRARAAFNSIFICIIFLFFLFCSAVHLHILTDKYKIYYKTANSPFQRHKKKKNKKLSSTLDIAVESTTTSFYARYFVSRFRYINGIFSCDCMLYREWMMYPHLRDGGSRAHTCGDLNFAVIFGHHHHHKPASNTHHVNVNRLFSLAV